MAELTFMRKAISLGFGVAKPWGDSDHYDFILNSGNLLWRVQVKSVWSKKSGYKIRVSGHSTRPYTAEQIDFLVAYIHPVERWYVLPVRILRNRLNIDFPVRGGKSQFDQYLDAWDLFREKPPPLPAL